MIVRMAGHKTRRWCTYYWHCTPESILESTWGESVFYPFVASINRLLRPFQNSSQPATTAASPGSETQPPPYVTKDICTLDGDALLECLCSFQPPKEGVGSSNCTSGISSSSLAVRNNTVFVPGGSSYPLWDLLAACPGLDGRHGGASACLGGDEAAPEDPALLGCHEPLAEYAAFLASVKFWVHGVAICVVGAFGLAGNALTFVVLGRDGAPPAPAAGRHCCCFPAKAGGGGDRVAAVSAAPGDSNRSFNRLLRALAVVDGALLVYLVAETAAIRTFSSEPPYWYRLAYPYLLHPLKGFVQTAAIYMVVAISAERYKAVCYPLR